MYQVDWQEYQNIQEYNSEQYKDLEEALKVYKDKAEMYYWAKLSHELLESINPNAETYQEIEENWKDNGGYEKQNQAMINSFGIDDRPVCQHCDVKMNPNHIVEPDVGRIFGHTCFNCGYSEWDR